MNWYVIYAARKSLNPSVDAEGKEDWSKTLLVRLKETGCETFWPKGRDLVHRPKTRTRPAFTEMVWLPIFGSYVFVGLPDGFEAGNLARTRGVRSLLNDADGEPGIIPSEYMDWARCKYRDYRMEVRVEEFAIKPGTTVRIMSGKLIGYGARCGLADLFNHTVTVSREIFGREIEFTLPLDAIEPA